MKSVDIHINSKDRTSGSNENLTMDLFLPINNIKNIKIKSIEIPLTHYVVNSTNNTINFTLGGSHTATLTPGNYTPNQLADEIKTEMNNVSAGFSVSYDNITHKFTISNAAPFDISFTGTTASKLIGLTTDTGSVTSYTSTNCIDLLGTRCIYIKSGAISLLNTKSYVSETMDNIIYKLPLIDENIFILGGNINEYIIINYTGPHSSMTTIDLQLLDDNLTVMDLNGLYWTITFTFYYT